MAKNAPQRTARRGILHMHASAVNLLIAFDGVLLIGTAWRLGTAYAAASKGPMIRRLGRAMAFQY